jgi:hypothetical protein
MNVIFHTLASVATTAVLSAQLKEKPLTSTAGFTVLGVGFATGVLLHGLLDWSPHQYPLAAAVDIVVSLILFAVVFLLAYHEARWILFACFLGAISPDLVDLGPRSSTSKCSGICRRSKSSLGIGNSIQARSMTQPAMAIIPEPSACCRRERMLDCQI